MVEIDIFQRVLADALTEGVAPDFSRCVGDLSEIFGPGKRIADSTPYENLVADIQQRGIRLDPTQAEYLVKTATRVKKAIPEPGFALTESGALVHSTADVDPSATLGEGAIIGPKVLISEGASVGPGAIVGDETILDEGALVGPGVRVADGVEIGPGASVDSFSRVGNEVRIHQGALVSSSDVHDGATIESGVEIRGQNIPEGRHVTSDLSGSAESSSSDMRFLNSRVRF